MNKIIRTTIIIATIVLVLSVFANALFSITSAIDYMQYSGYAFFGAFLVVCFCIAWSYLFPNSETK